jgi:hypothetical protein
MWWLLGFLVLALFVAIAIFMRDRGGFKAEKRNAARRKADAIISKQSYASLRKINRLINSIESSSKATDTTIPEEDRIRIEKLREIRDE